MNITPKIIITDTNIITDLSNAEILLKFVNLDNVYISDIIMNDEINNKTGNIDIIKKLKVLPINSYELAEISRLSKDNKELSIYDLSNFVLARDYDGIIATGDKKLREYSLDNGIPVIRTLSIIELMCANNFIDYSDAINGCLLLEMYENTRIPNRYIDDLIDKFMLALMVTYS